MSRNFIIALLGKSSSGKDSIARYLSNQLGFKYVISTTSRPMRSNEQQDVDYHFINENTFKALKDLDKFIEYRYYDTIQDNEPSRWHYGIERSEIDLSKSSAVAVVDIQGLNDLTKEFGSENILSFYIDVPYEVRKVRAIARDRNFEEDEFERRNISDDKQFQDVEKLVDKVIKNDNLDKCINDIIFNIDYAQKLKQFYTQYCSW